MVPCHPPILFFPLLIYAGRHCGEHLAWQVPRFAIEENAGDRAVQLQLWSHHLADWLIRPQQGSHRGFEHGEGPRVFMPGRALRCDRRGHCLNRCLQIGRSRIGIDRHAVGATASSQVADHSRAAIPFRSTCSPVQSEGRRTPELLFGVLAGAADGRGDLTFAYRSRGWCRANSAIRTRLASASWIWPVSRMLSSPFTALAAIQSYPVRVGTKLGVLAPAHAGAASNHSPQCRQVLMLASLDRAWSCSSQSAFTRVGGVNVNRGLLVIGLKVRPMSIRLHASPSSPNRTSVRRCGMPGPFPRALCPIDSAVLAMRRGNPYRCEASCPLWSRGTAVMYWNDC